MSRTRWPAGRLGQFPFYALPFFVWYPFYHLGLYAATANLRFLRTVERQPRILLAAFAAFVTAAMLEGDLLARDGFVSLATSQIKTTSFLASISLFLFSLANSNARQATLTAWQRILEYLGRRSYSIYLMHLLFLRPIASSLSRFGMIYRLQPVFVVSSVGLTLMACVAFNCCAELTLPTRFRLRYMGIG